MFDFSDERNYRTYKAGETIFDVGERGYDMFAVIEGEIEIRLGSNYISTARENEVFGEMALIDRKDRTATAYAVKDSTVAVISENRFRELSKNPDFALDMMRVVSSRLRTEMRIKRELSHEASLRAVGISVAS